jgi:hypothetical protein
VDICFVSLGGNFEGKRWPNPKKRRIRKEVKACATYTFPADVKSEILGSLLGLIQSLGGDVS